jgi:signal transduction histidine kinase
MRLKNDKRHLLTTYAIIFPMVVLVLMFLSWKFGQTYNVEKYVEQCQHIVQQKDRQLYEGLKEISDHYVYDTDSIFEHLPSLSQQFEKQGFIYLVFQNDSLVFWSNNSMPAIVNLKDGVENSGNGWYRCITVNTANRKIVGLYLIKQDYNYENKYLSNSFHSSFGLPNTVRFSSSQDDAFSIKDENNDFLFSLSFPPYKHLTSAQSSGLFVIYIVAVLLLLGFLYELYRMLYIRTGRWQLFIIGFILDVALVRVLLFYFRKPEALFQSRLFMPHYYAHSDWIPSIGDLFLNVLFVLIIGFFFYYHIKFHRKNLRKSRFHKVFLILTLFLHIFIFFKGIVFIFDSLIIDSNISLDLNNIFDLSWMSLFSFVIIAAAIHTYLLVTAKLAFFAYQYSQNFRHYTILATLIFVFLMALSFFFDRADFYHLVFVWFYILAYGFFFRKRVYQFNLPNIVFFVLMFSLFSTYAVHTYNDQREHENRKLLAVQLASEQRDPMTEYLFGRERKLILADTSLQNMLVNYGTPTFDQQGLESFFLKKYFTGYWKKYERQITLCDDDDILMIQPENIAVGCHEYFDEKIEMDGAATDTPGLAFVSYGSGDNGYIAAIHLNPASDSLSTRKMLYLELFPKYNARDLGFPDLLVDAEINTTPDLSQYSYAKYQNGELYKRVGNYFYNFNVDRNTNSDGQFRFINQNDYNHLYYQIDENKSLIISRKQKSVYDILAPFSYFFLLLGAFASLVFLIFIFPFSHHKVKLSFRTRLQLSMSAVILFSFLVIGIFTLFYINNLNDQKNKDLLSEKTHSILVEMQHKFSDLDAFSAQTTEMAGEQLIKFSNVFFTDINIFDLRGRLLASSRPQIYDEKLISRLMNPFAYKALTIEGSSLFIHNENIGLQHYLSAYIPFVNNRGHVIAFLNLPYFAKENDLNREISAFLVAYINIYVILIAISVLIALIISNYISRPLKMIMNRIRLVKLGGQNEMIDWKRRDEIGQLVQEYNRMIAELAQSAELLARSERESAWREMARQVAHEIKNPLTPMKLSVQYLQRAWSNNAPDWEVRLDKFTTTMIEQIETLSAIASEFSDFAKMPIARKQTIDLVEVIQSAISLFKNYQNISFDFNYDSGEKFTVFADKEQLLRALNNLLKNSVQAIGEESAGRIQLGLQRQGLMHKLSITDTGAGITPEVAEKIFSPYFTTKSGGMGLGLAIVKNIITGSGGDISYQPALPGGTTFLVRLPAVD